MEYVTFKRHFRSTQLFDLEVFLNPANNGNKRRNLMRNKILYYEVYLPLHKYPDLHHSLGVWNLPHKFHLYLILLI